MANDGMYRANWNLQNDGAGTVKSAISTMEAELSNLDTAARALMGVWSSSAQAAYESRHATWTSASDNIKSGLLALTSGLGDSAGISEGAENQALRTVQA